MGKKNTYNKALNSLLEKYDHSQVRTNDKKTRNTEFAKRKSIEVTTKPIDCPPWWDSKAWKQYTKENPWLDKGKKKKRKQMKQKDVKENA